MRLYTPSGPLGALIKLFATYLLFHLLVGHSTAFPFPATSLETRQSPNVNPLEARSLHKRSNCIKSDRAIWECDGDVPGVDETNTWMQQWGVVGTVPSVFYTGYPLNLDVAKRWAACFFPGEPEAPTKGSYLYAIWMRLVEPAYQMSQAAQIRAKKPSRVPAEDAPYYADMFLKHLAQSFAELSSGDVYVVVKDNVATDNRSWDTDKAWGGWEWPALTRNSNVQRILRVDPDTGDAPREIWTSADGPQGSDPLGERGSTKQVPLDEF